MSRVWTTKCAEQPDDAGPDGAGSDDARLVDGLRRGAPGAFAGLHERYAVGIYSLALRVVRHGPDAEDITQDVLLRAFERLPRDREVLLRPWLYRLTLNRCYDYLRSSARRPLPVAASGDGPSPLDPYEQSELQRLLEATIGDLTRRQRAALLLKDVHGLSLVEVAACLDLTPGSVEVLLARARRAFRTRFEERCSAAGRPLPRSSGGFAALPLLPLFPLPVGLATPPVGCVAPAALLPAPIVTAPIVSPPLLATGGLGAALGLPASIKTAVLIAAAAATVGTAEMAATHTDRRPPRPPAAAAVVPSSAVAPSPVAAPAVAAPAPRSTAKPAAPAFATATPGTDPAASPAPTAVAEPSPQGSPLGIVTPAPAPDPTAAPAPSPTAAATATPSPSSTPSPAAEAPGSPSPSPPASP